MKLRVLFLISLLFAIALGCNKVNDLVTPDNQNENSLKFSGTYYSGESDFTGVVIDEGEMIQLPNGNVKITGLITGWYEHAVDENLVPLPLLSGPSTYYENATYNINEPDIHFWGSVEIEAEEGGGVWQGHWNGHATFQGDPPYNFFLSPLVCEGLEVNLTGHGGDIQGMVAKATYSIDILNVGFWWTFTGEYK